MLRIFLILLAVVSWLAVGVYFALCVASFSLADILAGVLHFLQFFTILTNLLLALAFTAHAFETRFLRVLMRPRFATALALYAIVLQLVYTGFLRWQWHPSGVQLPVDILMHDVLPMAYLVLWFAKIPKGSLRYRDAVMWLLFPLAFIPYNALFSSLLQRNPYPFLDPARVGYAGVVLAAFLLAVLFFALGLALVAVDGALSRRAALAGINRGVLRGKAI